MAKETTEAEMLLRFVDGLKQASNSAWQMAHAQQNPSWLTVRDMLEGIREKAAQMAYRKSVPRQQVLTALDNRQRQIA